MLDFAKEIILDPKETAIYKKLRAVLYFLAMAAAILVAFRILFPTQYFVFDFANPNSAKNTASRPRDEQAAFFEKGVVPSGKTVSFFASLLGKYDTAEIIFRNDQSFSLPDSGKIVIRKSFQALLYPEADFNQAVYDDLYSEKSGRPYPSGTLVSNGGSVYVTSRNKLVPINNTVTFEAMGYAWDKVIPASSDEISFYEKEKLMTIASAHPDGSVLFDRDSKNHFLISDGKKMKIPAEYVLALDQKISRIMAASADAGTTAECVLKRSFLSKITLMCEIPVEKFEKLSGKDYKFIANFNQAAKINSIDVRFKQKVDWDNLKTTASTLLTRIRNNYVGQP